MASVSLDSLPHPQPCPSAVGPAERRPAAQNRGAPTVSSSHSDSVAVAPNASPNARLQNHDLTECIDLTASEPAEGLGPLGEPAIGFGDTQVHMKDPSTGPDPMSGQNDSDGPFLSIEEVLCGAQSSISDPPAATPSPPPPSPPPPSSPPPAAAADSVLPSTSQVQTDSRDDALRSIRPSSSAEGKEKADTDDGQNENRDKRDRDQTATGALGVRDPSKRTAGDAGLNEGGKGVSGSGKARRKGPIDAIDNSDQEMSDLEFARLRALPEPVFRMPPFWQDFQQHKNIAASPSRSSETGSSQENPLVVGDDDDEKPSENGGSTRATSVESKLGPATLQGPSPPEKTETHARLSTCTPGSTTARPAVSGPGSDSRP